MYSILINTCDKFEDCWDPFFKLWSLYWSDCKGKIYLNTEFKDFRHEGLDVHAIKGCIGKPFKGKYATWSQCLKWALDFIDTEIVLYMQEDYFLKAKVDNAVVENYVKLMEGHKDIQCIHLTDQSVHAEKPSEFENLDEVALKQRYRVSCQAALWRKEELYRLIREYENAWEFEEFGSQRSSIIGSRYLCVSHDYVRLDKYEIIPYIFTGIVQGRWMEQTKPLFEKHGIVMDWNRRGFLRDAPRKPIKKRIIYRWNKLWKLLRNEIELYKLKQNN